MSENIQEKIYYRCDGAETLAESRGDGGGVMDDSLLPWYVGNVRRALSRIDDERDAIEAVVA